MVFYIVNRSAHMVPSSKVFNCSDDSQLIVCGMAIYVMPRAMPTSLFFYFVLEFFIVARINEKRRRYFAVVRGLGGLVQSKHGALNEYQFIFV